MPRGPQVLAAKVVAVVRHADDEVEKSIAQFTGPGGAANVGRTYRWVTGHWSTRQSPPLKQPSKT